MFLFLKEKGLYLRFFFGGKFKNQDVKKLSRYGSDIWVLGSHVISGEAIRQETQMNTLQFARSHLRYVLCLM